MSGPLAAILGVGAYLVLAFALLMVVSKVYGTGWEISLIPAEAAGGIAIGFLIARLESP